jgi:TRAP-type C4-dicarboxylate transport system substrate-binding protein
MFGTAGIDENQPMARCARPFAAVLLAGLAFAGCFGGDSGTKAGATRGPVTLRLATDDPTDRPGSDQVAEFAHRVGALSGGDLAIEPVLNAGGDGSDWDQQVARKVRDGTFDMALVPTRAWDTEGVTSLRALSAPFLVTSDALLDEVVASDLADRLMSGLDDTGVHPLALWRESLRHPFGFGKALRGPADYDNRVIRTPTSSTTDAMFAALGATTDDSEAESARHAGMESSYLLKPTGIATGNVTFSAKAGVLVINDEAFAKLDEDRRRVLERAAAETREWATEMAPSDAEAAQLYCAKGGVVALAGGDDVAALEAATAPVYAELERDPVTKELIAAIRDLRDGLAPPPAATACGRALAAARGSGRATARFDGVYRFEITDEQLRDAGITNPPDVDENHGIYTVTLRGGEYCWEQRAPNPLNNPDECSSYEVEGDRVTWNFPAGPPEVYAFDKTAAGDLAVSVVRVSSPAERPYAEVWAANTWQRIGGGE